MLSKRNQVTIAYFLLIIKQKAKENQPSVLPFACQSTGKQLSLLWLGSYHLTRKLRVNIKLGTVQIIFASHKGMLMSCMLRNLYCPSCGFKANINSGLCECCAPNTKDSLSLMSVFEYFICRTQKHSMQPCNCSTSGKGSTSKMLGKETSGIQTTEPMIL